MPFQIVKKENDYKFKYKNNLHFKLSIKKEQLNDQIDLGQLMKGLNLLNINYVYLMENILGDPKQLDDWFDMRFFFSNLPNQNEDIGSIENILKEKNDVTADFGFEVLDLD